MLGVVLFEVLDLRIVDQSHGTGKACQLVQARVC